MPTLVLALLLAATPQAPGPTPAGPEGRTTALRRDILSPLRVLWKQDLLAPSIGGACAADVDGDGRLDLAFGTSSGDSRVLMLSGKDGRKLWTRDFGEGQGRSRLDASFRFYTEVSYFDISLLVPVSDRGELYALAPDTGETIWSYCVGNGEGIASPPTLADVDFDGFPEIVFSSSQGKLHVVDMEGRPLRREHQAAGVATTGIVILDADLDGTPDFLLGAAQGDNLLACISGASGHERWHVPAARRNELDLGTCHGPTIGDLDLDGTPEVVLTADDGSVRCLALLDGKERWRAVPGDRGFRSPPAIGDLDGDGRPEVVVVGQRATVIDGRGKVRWSVPIAPADSPLAADGGPSLADLDGDHLPDLALLRADGWFAVLRGSTGQLIYELPPQQVTSRPVVGCEHGPLLADLDGDGALDAFYVVGNPQPGNRFGIAVAVTGFAGRGNGWYMLRHDAQHTGNLATALPWPLRVNIDRTRPYVPPK